MKENKLEESSKIIRKLISEKNIVRPREGAADFFVEKSRQSIRVASRLFEINREEALETAMWVINSSYYSMFFAATALLAHHGHRIKVEAGIHKITYHAIAHYFIIESNKLEKHFIEEYKDAVEEAEELLQLSSEKSLKLISDFDNEMYKRKIFTYDLGRIAEKQKAETSLKRAKNFVKEIEKMLR
ncbi:hypothetical protein GF323_01495 [Candidatus Woesearchaeota archaeon]|nr:hypothetical protein [Candidatus Woesearchaeota archaeon]